MPQHWFEEYWKRTMTSGPPEPCEWCRTNAACAIEAAFEELLNALPEEAVMVSFHEIRAAIEEVQP